MFLCFTAFSKTFKHYSAVYHLQLRNNTKLLNSYLRSYLFIYLLNTDHFLIGFNIPANSSKPVGSDQIWKMPAIYY